MENHNEKMEDMYFPISIQKASVGFSIAGGLIKMTEHPRE